MNQSNSNPSFSEADLAFRFTPGCLCLNLVATIGERGDRKIERLRNREDLAKWCQKAGILDELPRVETKELSSTKELREAIYRVTQAIISSDRPQLKDLETINFRAKFPPPVPQLLTENRTKVYRADRPIEAALSAIARDAIDLLSSSRINRIKACANPQCQMLFLDTSRPGNRRWCLMTGKGCGNRAKKAAFRQRQKNA